MKIALQCCQNNVKMIAKEQNGKVREETQLGDILIVKQTKTKLRTQRMIEQDK